MSNVAPGGFDALRLSPQDNVATVLRTIAAGETVRVKCGDGVEPVLATEPIPFCHKISLAQIFTGEPVVKYGSAIGAASAPIAAGAHVHVHNLRSARARGDRADAGVTPRAHQG